MSVSAMTIASLLFCGIAFGTIRILVGEKKELCATIHINRAATVSATLVNETFFIDAEMGVATLIPLGSGIVKISATIKNVGGELEGPNGEGQGAGEEVDAYFEVKSTTLDSWSLGPISGVSVNTGVSAHSLGSFIGT